MLSNRACWALDASGPSRIITRLQWPHRATRGMNIYLTLLYQRSRHTALLMASSVLQALSAYSGSHPLVLVLVPKAGMLRSEHCTFLTPTGKCFRSDD